ncbi:hypothetical protein PCE1_003313 [Barthelona sp. PCE]
MKEPLKDGTEPPSALTDLIDRRIPKLSTLRNARSLMTHSESQTYEIIPVRLVELCDQLTHNDYKTVGRAIADLQNFLLDQRKEDLIQQHSAIKYACYVLYLHSSSSYRESGAQIWIFFLKKISKDVKGILRDLIPLWMLFMHDSNPTIASSTSDYFLRLLNDEKQRILTKKTFKHFRKHIVTLVGDPNEDERVGNAVFEMIPFYTHVYQTVSRTLGFSMLSWILNKLAEEYIPMILTYLSENAVFSNIFKFLKESHEISDALLNNDVDSMSSTVIDCLYREQINLREVLYKNLQILFNAYSKYFFANVCHNDVAKIFSYYPLIDILLKENNIELSQKSFNTIYRMLIILNYNNLRKTFYDQQLIIDSQELYNERTIELIKLLIKHLVWTDINRMNKNIYLLVLPVFGSLPIRLLFEKDHSMALLCASAVDAVFHPTTIYSELPIAIYSPVITCFCELMMYLGKIGFHMKDNVNVVDFFNVFLENMDLGLAFKHVSNSKKYMQSFTTFFKYISSISPDLALNNLFNITKVIFSEETMESINEIGQKKLEPMVSFALSTIGNIAQTVPQSAVKFREHFADELVAFLQLIKSEVDALVSLDHKRLNVERLVPSLIKMIDSFIIHTDYWLRQESADLLLEFAVEHPSIMSYPRVIHTIIEIHRRCKTLPMCMERCMSVLNEVQYTVVLDLIDAIKPSDDIDVTLFSEKGWFGESVVSRFITEINSEKATLSNWSKILRSFIKKKLISGTVFSQLLTILSENANKPRFKGFATMLLSHLFLVDIDDITGKVAAFCFVHFSLVSIEDYEESVAEHLFPDGNYTPDQIFDTTLDIHQFIHADVVRCVESLSKQDRGFISKHIRGKWLVNLSPLEFFHIIWFLLKIGRFALDELNDCQRNVASTMFLIAENTLSPAMLLPVVKNFSFLLYHKQMLNLLDYTAPDWRLLYLMVMKKAHIYSGVSSASESEISCSSFGCFMGKEACQRVLLRIFVHLLKPNFMPSMALAELKKTCSAFIKTGEPYLLSDIIILSLLTDVSSLEFSILENWSSMHVYIHTLLRKSVDFSSLAVTDSSSVQSFSYSSESVPSELIIKYFIEKLSLVDPVDVWCLLFLIPLDVYEIIAVNEPKIADKTNPDVLLYLHLKGFDVRDHILSSLLKQPCDPITQRLFVIQPPNAIQCIDDIVELFSNHCLFCTDTKDMTATLFGLLKLLPHNVMIDLSPFGQILATPMCALHLRIIAFIILNSNVESIRLMASQELLFTLIKSLESTSDMGLLPAVLITLCILYVVDVENKLDVILDLFASFAFNRVFQLCGGAFVEKTFSRNQLLSIDENPSIGVGLLVRICADYFPVTIRTSRIYYHQVFKLLTNDMNYYTQNRLTIIQRMSKDIAPDHTTLTFNNDQTITITSSTQTFSVSAKIILRSRYPFEFPSLRLVSKKDSLAKFEQDLQKACLIRANTPLFLLQKQFPNDDVKMNDHVLILIDLWCSMFNSYITEIENPCLICFSRFFNGQIPSIVCDTCGQTFHRRCLSSWLKVSEQPTCPHCRSVINV